MSKYLFLNRTPMSRTRRLWIKTLRLRDRVIRLMKRNG